MSASESYYAKEEISDLFFVLKSIALLRRESDIAELNATQKYYLAGALRSKIIRFSDKEVHDLFNDAVSLEWFSPDLDLSSLERGLQFCLGFTTFR